MNPKFHHKGKPCVRCGGTLRYIKGKNCVACLAKYKNRWNAEAYARDPEDQRVRSARWRENNRDRERERYQRWVENNREKRAASERANYARRRNADGSISETEIQQLLRDQKGKCAYFKLCGTRIENEFVCDHIIPIVAGGPHYAWNRQLLCAPCNLRKGRTDPVIFAERNGLTPSRALPLQKLSGDAFRP